MIVKLMSAQEMLMRDAQELKPIVFKDGSIMDVGILVSGNRYRTAVALEKKGKGTLQYQGPGNRGWFRALKEAN